MRLTQRFSECENSNKILDFSRSENLWIRRISIVSTFTFIKNSEFNKTLEIANLLLNDDHDLIHKAVGW
ncbi:MAG: DNA alkylation repair protein, partial [Candidatus Marinimicrobia bacterium]|nr:DNA alkylation repair protein [Candidatus Neomarinimicrobiota bacterium]